MFSAVLTLAAGASACPTTAEARVSVEERYSFETAWNATVRLLRVDLGYRIVERDRETGFLLFAYGTPTRPVQGSVELVPYRAGGQDGCRIIVQVSNMPTYVERHLVGQLTRKLHDEYGDPPPPPPSQRRPPPSLPDDGDAHGDAEGSGRAEGHPTGGAPSPDGAPRSSQ